MTSRKKAGLIVGAGVGVAAATALRRRWKGRSEAPASPTPIALESEAAGCSVSRKSLGRGSPSDGVVDRWRRCRCVRGVSGHARRAYPLVHSRLTRELIGAHSLLFTWRGTDSTAAPFLVMAHQDVVPVEPGTEANWEHPPFSGAIADGFLWGRGSIDDKASLIGILEGIESLLAEGFTPGPTVYVFLGHDEEVGGERGAAVVAARFGERAERLAFVLDEGGAVVSGLLPGVPPLALVGIGEKASLDVEITAVGEGDTLRCLRCIRPSDCCPRRCEQSRRTR